MNTPRKRVSSLEQRIAVIPNPEANPIGDAELGSFMYALKSGRSVLYKGNTYQPLKTTKVV